MTPEEFAALPWHARNKVINQRLRLARADHGVAPSEARSVHWAQKVRDDAVAILSALPPDPDAAAHRAAVMR